MNKQKVWIETDEDADWLIAVQLQKEQEVPGYVADKHLPRPASAAKARRPVVRLVAEKKFNPNQPRDPKGTPTGGQWTPEYRFGSDTQVPLIIEPGNTSWLARMELEDAKLPASHTDGLDTVGFTENTLIGYRKSDGTIGEAYGIYSIERRRITLASNADNIHVYGGATLLHEIGHHVHIAKLTNEAAEQWAALSRDGDAALISAYARMNRGEHFAEAYRAYARGGEHRRKLKNLEPASYKFMQRLFRPSGTPDIMPSGFYTSYDEGVERYGKQWQ